jgi:hypothetical protein
MEMRPFLRIHLNPEVAAELNNIARQMLLDSEKDDFCKKKKVVVQSSEPQTVVMRKDNFPLFIF